MQQWLRNFALRGFVALVLVLGLGLGLQRELWAFPHTIGHGYNSCLNCHFNPAGGGPLTDYGRAVGATAFAAVPFYTKKSGATPEEIDERLGQQSGFLGSVGLPKWLRPGANFRTLYLQQNITGDSSVSRWITMQAEANLVLKTK